MRILGLCISLKPMAIGRFLLNEWSKKKKPKLPYMCIHRFTCLPVRLPIKTLFYINIIDHDRKTTADNESYLFNLHSTDFCSSFWLCAKPSTKQMLNSIILQRKMCLIKSRQQSVFFL